MVRILVSGSVLIALAGLSGCGMGSGSPSVVTTPQVKATGAVHGGQQPVTGATIQLWQVGTTGYGSAATPLISAAVTTSDGTGNMNSNANAGNENNTLPIGQFTLNFTNAYSCPTTGSTLVYMTATGGNPGLGGTVNNTAIVLLAALGQCGSALTSTTFISLNEVTTAGAVENLSTFMSASGSIGSPADATSQQAIANAFAAVSKMVSNTTGAALTGFPKLSTIANAMVPCVNSVGPPTSSDCSTLFGDTTPSGGGVPSTILGAILNIALNPTLNTSAIYLISTANAPFQPASTSAPSVWSITTAGADTSACGYSGGLDNVSGTVSYTGTQTGRIYLALNTTTAGCETGTAGTSISGPGAFTIHGVPPGSYTLSAFMDVGTYNNKAFGTLNAADPVGSVSVTASSVNTTGANVTISDPGSVTISSSPVLAEIGPYSGGAVVEFGGVKSNGVESATSYTLQWSTDNFSSVAGSQTFPATGNDTSVWFVNGLTNGTAYYFRAYASSGGTPLGGPVSGVYGPLTIGTGSTGSAVSGSVTFTGSAAGPMYVGYYNQDSGAAPPYLESITGAMSMQAYTVDVPISTSAVYIPVGEIDQNNDGVVDPGDITNINLQGGPIAVTGPLSNQSLTLPSGNVLANVSTEHFYDAGVSQKYGVYFLLNFLGKLPVAVTLQNSYNSDGANIDNGPIDIANCAVPNVSCNLGQSGFQVFYTFGSTITPSVGDTYLFNVTYSDGSSETVPVAISGVLSTPATNLSPTSGSNLTPNFSWIDPTCGLCSTYTYTFLISGSGWGYWYVPSNGNGLPPGTTSVTWNTDPTSGSNAVPGPLNTSTTYSWSVTVQDSNYNQAINTVSYTP